MSTISSSLYVSINGNRVRKKGRGRRRGRGREGGKEGGRERERERERERKPLEKRPCPALWICQPSLPTHI